MTPARAPGAPRTPRTTPTGGLLSALPALLAVALWLLPGELAGQEPLYDLVVSSRNDHSVKLYDGEDGTFVRDLVPPRRGGLGLPQEVLSGPDGELLVTGRENPAVLRYDAATGEFLGEFTRGYDLDNPTKTVWGPAGDLFVSQWGETRSTVARFDGSTGAFLEEVTPELDRPMQAAWDDAGILHVVSFGSQDVRRFDADGALIDVFADQLMLGPVNLRFDDAGDLIVADWQGGAIRRYDGGDGSYVEDVVAGLASPEGWTFGPDGALYVGEWSANRIRRLDPEQGINEIFADGGGLSAPNSLMFVEREPELGIEASLARSSLSGGESTTLTVTLEAPRRVPPTEPVALSCTSSSGRASCALSRTSIEVGASGATVEATVTTTPASAAGSGAAETGRGTAGSGGVPGGAALLALLALGALVGIRWGPATARMSLAATLSVALAAGCSGSDGAGPPEVEEPDPVTVTLTVEASAGALDESTEVTLTVR